MKKTNKQTTKQKEENIIEREIIRMKRYKTVNSNS